MLYVYLFLLVFLSGCKTEQDVVKTVDDAELVVEDVKQDVSDIKAL